MSADIDRRAKCEIQSTKSERDPKHEAENVLGISGALLEMTTFLRMGAFEYRAWRSIACGCQPAAGECPVDPAEQVMTPVEADGVGRGAKMALRLA